MRIKIFGIEIGVPTQQVPEVIKDVQKKLYGDPGEQVWVDGQLVAGSRRFRDIIESTPENRNYGTEVRS